MAAAQDELILIDGHHLLFRMFYGVQSKLRSRDGVLINAVLGFTGAVIRYVNAYAPRYLLVVFDSERPSFRAAVAAEYKGNRQSDFSGVGKDENPFVQLPIIKETLDRLRLHYCEVDGFEADDVIASYAKGYAAVRKRIISGDSDLLQLVDENAVVYMDRGKKSILYDEEMVIRRFHVSPKEIVDYKALTGDASDHIRGLAGVGPKTAAGLLQGFGSIQRMLESPDGITPPALRGRIVEGRELLRRNQDLIRLRRDVPLDFALSDLSVDPSSFAGKKAVEILREGRYL